MSFFTMMLIAYCIGFVITGVSLLSDEKVPLSEIGGVRRISIGIWTIFWPLFWILVLLLVIWYMLKYMFTPKKD